MSRNNEGTAIEDGFATLLADGNTYGGCGSDNLKPHRPAADKGVEEGFHIILECTVGGSDILPETTGEELVDFHRAFEKTL